MDQLKRFGFKDKDPAKLGTEREVDELVVRLHVDVEVVVACAFVVDEAVEVREWVNVIHEPRWRGIWGGVTGLLKATPIKWGNLMRF